MSELESETTTPEAVAPEPMEAEAPAAPTWTGPTQEEWEQTQQALEYVSSLMQPTFPQREDAPQEIELDPLDDGFRSQLDQWFDQKVAPYAEYVRAQQSQEGEQRSKDVLTDLASRDGDFDIDRAYEVALARFREAAAVQPAAASWELLEKTLGQAAQDQRTYDKKVAEAAVERYKNELAGLSGARSELPAGATNGSQQFTVPQGGGLVDVAYRHSGN